MNVIADDLIVFSGDDVGGENDTCIFRFYEFLDNDSDAFAGYVIAVFVFFDTVALCRSCDITYGISDLGNSNVREGLILTCKLVVRAVFADGR